jgi:hypothetical protein
MRGMIVNLGIALMTFSVGVGCELLLNKRPEATSRVVIGSVLTTREQIGSAKPLPSEQSATQIPPGSLPSELLRIDEKYRRRCQLPTDWSGEWPAIKQLQSFSDCNDEWAIARHKAIREEIDNYMVRY